MSFDSDLLVVGGGSGGVRAARVAGGASPHRRTETHKEALLRACWVKLARHLEEGHQVCFLPRLFLSPAVPLKGTQVLRNR